MARLVIELTPSDTGHVLGDFTWDFCKKVVDASIVSTTGATLTELGNGAYILANSNVVSDTAFRLHLTADTNKYASGIFSVADDNLALANADFNSTQKTSVENAVWDAARASHVTAGSFGLVNQAVADGTAQGGSANTITLASSSKGTDQYYTGDLLYVYAGPGAGQSVIVSNYVGSTKVATVSPPWDTVPTSASKYVILMTMSPIVGSDVKSLISADAQDLSATLKVDAKVVEDKTGYSLATAPPTSATIAAAVWDLAISGHLTSGTTGAALNAAGAAGDPWSTTLPGVYGAGTAGNIIGNRMDAAISSRSTYAGADTSGTTTLLSRIAGTIPTNPLLTTDGRLNYLDATVSSRLATSGYTAPDNTDIGTILTMLQSATYGLNALLTAVNSRLAASSYTAPDNTDIAAIKADVESSINGLGSIIGAIGNLPTLSAIRGGITADHGAGAYGPGVAGIYTINLQTVAAGSNPAIPIPDVAVGLYNADGSVLIGARVTDSLGQTSFNVNNGDYLLKHRKAGYVFADDTATVSDASVNHTCQGTAFVIPVNGDPDTQILFFSGVQGDSTALSGKQVIARPLTGQVINQSLVAKQQLVVTLDSNGDGTLTLLRGIDYNITANWWAGTVQLTVTQDAIRSFADYVQGLDALPVIEE